MEEVTFFLQEDSNMLHIGGFNSLINKYDIRNLKKPILVSDDLGGGIWRLSKYGGLIGCANCSGDSFQVLSSDCNFMFNNR